MNEKSKAVAIPIRGEVQQADPMESLLQRAVDTGSVEVLERLLAVKKEVQAGRARDAFYEALTAFQSHCPVIGKNTEASIQSRTGASFKYRYTPLEDIAHAIRPLLEQYALGYRWFATQTAPKSITVTCRISHILGYVEESSLTVPIGEDPQRPAWPVAQSLTYAKRYTLCNSLGIVVGGEDDDAHESTQDAVPPTHADQWTPSQAAPPPTAPPPAPSAAIISISEAQSKRLYAIAKSAGYTDEGIKDVLASYHYQHSKDIRKADYEMICTTLSQPPIGGDEVPF